MEVEEATVRAFVARNRQDRWLLGLASKKRRQQIVDRLHGEADFREDLMQRYSGDLSSLERELRQRGAPDACHVIGGSQDGEDRALRDALAAAVDGYGGVLLVCLPGMLAVHFPEAPAEPFSLSRQRVYRVPGGSSPPGRHPVAMASRSTATSESAAASPFTRSAYSAGRRTPWLGRTAT